MIAFQKKLTLIITSILRVPVRLSNQSSNYNNIILYEMKSKLIITKCSFPVEGLKIQSC